MWWLNNVFKQKDNAEDVKWKVRPLVLSVHWRDFGEFSFGSTATFRPLEGTRHSRHWGTRLSANAFISFKKGLSCQIMRSQLLSSFTHVTWNAGWTLRDKGSKRNTVEGFTTRSTCKGPTKQGGRFWESIWRGRKARLSGRDYRNAYHWEHWDKSRRVGKAHPFPESTTEILPNLLLHLRWLHQIGWAWPLRTW